MADENNKSRGAISYKLPLCKFFEGQFPWEIVLKQKQFSENTRKKTDVKLSEKLTKVEGTKSININESRYNWKLNNTFHDHAVAFKQSRTGTFSWTGICMHNS